MKKIHINEPKSYKGHSLILLLLLNIFDGLITYIGLDLVNFKIFFLLALEAT